MRSTTYFIRCIHLLWCGSVIKMMVSIAGEYQLALMFPRSAWVQDVVSWHHRAGKLGMGWSEQFIEEKFPPQRGGVNPSLGISQHWERKLLLLLLLLLLLNLSMTKTINMSSSLFDFSAVASWTPFYLISFTWVCIALSIHEKMPTQTEKEQ